jgi:hypothetical protein
MRKAATIYAVRIRPRVTVRTEIAKSATAAAKLAATWAARGYTVSIATRSEPTK